MNSILSISQINFIRGGSDKYRFELNKLLSDNDYEIIPFSAQHPDNQASTWSRFFPQGVNFDDPSAADLLRYIYSRPAARAIDRLLQENRIDLAHLHIYYGQLTASILAPLKRRGIPIVQTLHEFKLVCPTYGLVTADGPCEACAGRHFWRAVQNRCNRGSLARSCLSAAESYVSRWFGARDKIDHFITVSDFQRRKLIDLGAPADRISTVHNFIDAELVQPNFEQGSYCLYFGRLEKSKGLWTLLRAAEQLPEVPLYIAGDGSEHEALKQHLSKPGMEHVHYVGFKQGDELSKLIRGSICTITVSECYETFGLALIESFAHGRPVVASRMGGMPEVVTEGEDGFLIEAGDHQALAEWMKWMSEHPSEAIEMGRKGRKKVIEQFSPQRHLAQIEAVYGKVL
ncbi:MAG: glycosyltransferase family 1 protein [endosymbiont of Escarpia spicata]|uniref:Glycosyltransferase family 1 protein n=1 Tax=endosymbiont of Escarpia spicata TaxID=2200908 RepID=A0A370DLQ2_9GAMM|nr:MAG: glycosyltransferase family 1 protein [endosymbiont of Escarpia spicata]